MNELSIIVVCLIGFTMSWTASTTSKTSKLVWIPRLSSGIFALVAAWASL